VFLVALADILIIAIESTKSRREEHIACKWEKRNAYTIFVEKPEERGHWEKLDIDGMILFECILRKKDGVIWTGFIWLRTGISGVLLRTG
jgi:hypothetical protein